MPNLVEPMRAAPSLDPLEAWLDTLEQMQRAVGAEIRKAARSLIGASRESLDRWAEMCKDVAAGQTAQVHAQRTHFLASLHTRLAALNRMHTLVRRWNPSATESDELRTDIAALEKLHTQLTSRWQDEEGLEYLAVEALMPSTERLKTLATNHSPPQAWYEQTADPFQE